MKPKENTIDKIDRIFEDISRFPTSSFNLTLAQDIQQRCHTMNIHKAKVVYFKRIKLMLTQALELIEKKHKHPELNLQKDFNQVEREIRALLDARNG
ncbi:MAG: hypothetical protein U9R66_14785 [Thermodesulfobacteriota bacterium]|nr:hypothetical protein [Thermodesulfobacteriota bacterium]